MFACMNYAISGDLEAFKHSFEVNSVILNNSYS